MIAKFALFLLFISAMLLAYVGYSNWQVGQLIAQGLKHDGRFYAESFVELSIAFGCGIAGVCLYKE